MLDVWNNLLYRYLIFFAGPVILGVLVFLFILLNNRSRFRKRCLAVLEDKELAEPLILSYYTKDKLYRYSDIIKKIDWSRNGTLYEILGLDKIWMERLLQKNDRKSFDCLLKFFVQEALFDCFLKALDNALLRKDFQKWIVEVTHSRAFLEIAMACRGEEFNGSRSLELFQEILTEIRNLAGRPEKNIRYFVIKTLLHDNTDLTRRVLWESFRDPYYRIRMSLASEFTGQDRQRMYNELFRLYIGDPVRQVRIAARNRINRDFSDLYSINLTNLSDYERLHALEHLDKNSKADENLALDFLESDKLEERFTAAVFLETCGTLKRMMNQADLGDKEDFNRKLHLLTLASDVKVTHFFDEAVNSQNPATLYLAAQILDTTGRRDFINPISRAIFKLPLDSSDAKKIFISALSCIRNRGNEESFTILKDIMIRYKDNQDVLSVILKHFPIRGVFVFKDLLLDFLKDPHFPCYESLRNIVLQSPPYLFVEELFEILHYPDRYHLKVRKETLKILARMGKPDLTQNMLENLYLLEREEAEELASLIVSENEKRFNAILNRLMESKDSSVREALLLILPGLGKKENLSYIQESLEDSDPDVRIAAVRAFVRFPTIKDYKEAFPLLEDPLAFVREETARSLGATDDKNALKHLSGLLKDTGEIRPVKIAAIHGLGASTSLTAVEMLVEVLDEQEELIPEVTQVLSQKASTSEIVHLLKFFKESVPELREKLVEVFSAMGSVCEKILFDILKTDNTGLRPYVCHVLESTGYIVSQSVRLRHRKVEERLDAADNLITIGTPSAYRALIPAAKDINKTVRLKVIQGLSRIPEKESRKILQELVEDPDRQIRRHAVWAQNRLKMNGDS